ncbi:GNAT family N-acetyltransferase [Sediminitomix flava]|uniref:N-acetylglutamate synthase-like GNAT family acetyltransferase n=1 Tax=Sediminitomix flava TaxID=379075 RepID=A0A315ZB77_SEDFL|nr:GNAT family N-acetyltransferase [Sediminitomix flava]PWJ42313.1 N-acetylglutamate synthase-like GNAT family acetyltransferase [Sediminitomix flava]
MIRKYTPKDKNELLKLFRLNSPKYFDSSEEVDFEDYLEHEIEDYFIYETNNQIIGCGGINYFLEGGIARISWDIIHPEFHGKGIGKKLTENRLSIIRENKDIQKIIVRTSQIVYPFYEKMGFELEKVVKDFWAENYDLYQMKISLN